MYIEVWAALPLVKYTVVALGFVICKKHINIFTSLLCNKSIHRKNLSTLLTTFVSTLTLYL